VGEASVFQTSDQSGRSGARNTEHTGEIAGSLWSENDKDMQCREIPLSCRELGNSGDDPDCPRGGDGVEQQLCRW
jgi:hypothetical protein